MKLTACAFFSIAIILNFGGLFAIPALGQEIDREKTKAKSRITSKYDKSKNLTTVRLKQITISRLSQEKEIANNIPLHQMGFDLSFSYTGQQPTKSTDEVLLRFYSAASNYVFLRGQQVIAVIDKEIQGQDRAFSLGMTDYKSNPPKVNTIYEEVMAVKIPADGLVKMAKANSLELYLGPVAYRLTKDQISSIREAASFLNTQ